MFFSTDLLQVKSSPFYRIYQLGIAGVNEKTKSKRCDNKLDVLKISEALREWLIRQDQHRISLDLSCTLVLGYNRLVRKQVYLLRQDVTTASLELRRSLRMGKTLNEKNPIDLVIPKNVDLMIGDPLPADSFDQNNVGLLIDSMERIQVPVETITMREIDEGEERLVDEEDENFGLDPAAFRNPTSLNLFDEDEDFLPTPNDRLRNIDTTEANFIPDIDPNAPPRTSGPKNGCREKSPPAFPEISQNQTQPMDVDPVIEALPDPDVPDIITEDTLEQNNVVQMADIEGTPKTPENPMMNDVPPVEIETPVEEQEIQDLDQNADLNQGHQVDRNEDQSPPQLSLGTLEDQPAPKKRKKNAKKRFNKRLIIDVETQIDTKEMQKMRENWDDLMRSNDLPDIDLTNANILLVNRLGRPCSSKVLKNLFIEAAHDEKCSEEDFEAFLNQGNPEQADEQPIDFIPPPENVIEEQENVDESSDSAVRDVSNLRGHGNETRISTDHVQDPTLDDADRVSVGGPRGPRGSTLTSNIELSRSRMSDSEANMPGEIRENVDNENHTDLQIPEVVLERSHELPTVEEEPSQIDESPTANNDMPVPEVPDIDPNAEQENQNVYEDLPQSFLQRDYKDDIMRNVSEELKNFKEILRDMGLTKRHEVAKAFENLLQLDKEAKVSVYQEEFSGPIFVKLV